MADWKTVRFDPTYEEKLDPEIAPLCDALNSAGIVTISSCVGHGHSWPHVWFEHSSDERIERLARFVKETEAGDYRPYFTMWQKEILPDGYAWSVELHLNDVYSDTPPAVRIAKENDALARVTQAVADFGVREFRYTKAGNFGYLSLVTLVIFLSLPAPAIIVVWRTL